jgi:hypothetical protein
MTARLDAAKEVKRSPRQTPGGRTGRTAASASPSLIARFGRPTPLWAFGVTALALMAAFAAWQWYRGSDATPKRWTSEKETFSACFKTLTTASASPTDTCFHPEDQKLGQRPFDWVAPSVAVYSTAAPVHPSTTLRDLSDRGQAEAIRFLEADSGLKGKAWADFNDALDDSRSGAGERDPFKFDRILVANVAKGIDWRPGDRMVWTRVLIEPINFSFAGYSVAETDNETLKVTSVERTDSRKFSADLSATIPGMEGPKADLGPSSEHSVKTSSDINAQYEKLGVDIMPNFLRIMRESETGGDAVGNTKVSLTAVTDPETIWRRYPNEAARRASDGDPVVLLVTATHFDADGADDRVASGAAKPLIEVLPETPVPHCALRARIWMIYEKRQVDKGRESYDESKQDVTLAHDAEDKQDVDIVSADEVSPAVWSLKICRDARCSNADQNYLKAKVLPEAQDEAAWRKVVFTDYGVAVRLAHWLRTKQKSTPPGVSYKFNYPGDGSYAAFRLVKVTGDACKGEPLERVGAR